MKNLKYQDVVRFKRGSSHYGHLGVVVSEGKSCEGLISIMLFGENNEPPCTITAYTGEVTIADALQARTAPNMHALIERFNGYDGTSGYRESMKSEAWDVICDEFSSTAEELQALNTVCRSHWLRSYGLNFGRHPSFDEYREHWVAAQLPNPNMAKVVPTLKKMQKAFGIPTPTKPNMAMGHTTWNSRNKK